MQAEDREAELDRLREQVIEEVMGRTPARVMIETGKMINVSYRRGEHEPNYSRDIAAAWLVVRNIEHRGYYWKIHTPFRQGDPHFAGVTPQGITGWNGRPDFEGSGETMPEAICKAALLVVRAERKQGAG